MHKYQDVSVSEFGSVKKKANGAVTGQKNIIVSGVKAGRVKVVWIQAESNEFFEYTKWFRVKALKSVWVAKRDIPKGHELSAEDFEMSVEDIAPTEGLKKLVAEAPLGRYTNRHVKQGAKISDEMFSQKPLIEAQSAVDLILMNAGVKISGRGLAVTRGASVGSKILVKFRNNPQSYTGVVMNENTVMVEF